MGDRLSDVVLLPGPWTHRNIAANGCRFHVAEIGSGPLVLLLHGFPEMWWAWRDQLTALAAAGYWAVAMDLRGVGGSDKPPRGYDPLTFASDVAGVIRALGEQQAVLVGQGDGARIAWTLTSLRPSLVRGLAVTGSAHPRSLRSALTHDAGQLKAFSFVANAQVPWLPERLLVADDAAAVERYLARWGARPWPDPEAAGCYRAAMALPAVAHCALEVFRWTFRSVTRTDGRRWLDSVRQPVSVPVLHLQGCEDALILHTAVAGTAAYADRGYDLIRIPGSGHFVPEEAPREVNKELVGWLGSL